MTLEEKKNVYFRLFLETCTTTTKQRRKLSWKFYIIINRQHYDSWDYIISSAINERNFYALLFPGVCVCVCAERNDENEGDDIVICNERS